MKTQHSTEVSSSNPWLPNQVESRILLPVVHRLKRLGIDGNNCYIVPCSLVLLVAANMSKSYCLTPPLWRKAVQRYCHFWNWQIFLRLVFSKLLTFFFDFIIIFWFNANYKNKKFLRKMHFFLKQRQKPQKTAQCWNASKCFHSEWYNVHISIAPFDPIWCA